MSDTETTATVTYRVSVQIDGDRKVTKDYVRRVAAKKFFDHMTALYGCGDRKPRDRGIIRVRAHERQAG